MEFIREALSKAKAAGDQQPQREHLDRPAVGMTRSAPTASWSAAKPIPDAKPVSVLWAPPLVSLQPSHLESHRIVSLTASDPAHVAFNLLRTRVRKELADRQWTSIAVTSPTPGCGKTVVAINLALSLGRAPDCRVVLIDLDLRRSMIGRSLGIEAKGSVSEFLQGRGNAEDCFLRLSDSIFVGLNDKPARHSAELMQGPRMQALVSEVKKHLAPDILIFDLPPILSNDDALSFLPTAEGVLLVVGAGTSKPTDVEEAERQISQMDKLIGVVLNKSEDRSDNVYHYS